MWNVYQAEEGEGGPNRVGVEIRGESYRWGRWESMEVSTHVTPHTEVMGHGVICSNIYIELQ